MIRNVKTAEHYRWGDECDGWHLLEQPDLSVIQERIPPGSGEVQHYHARARQLFYLLAGELEIQLRERVFSLSPGDALEIPPGDAHLVRNRGRVDAVFHVVSSPTTRDDRVNIER
jgi:mannose-6-phosphate isomerase-like protein (cupin superfamily)